MLLLSLLIAAQAATPAQRLAAAVVDGRSADVQALIRAGADLNAPDDAGMTPLMIAAGAPVHAADAAGGTAITYAAAKGNAEVVGLLATSGAKWSEVELAMAANGCRGAVVDWMLKHGANANAARSGRSLLMAAAAGGCIDTVRPLVAAGANVNAKDAAGRTP